MGLQSVSLSLNMCYNWHLFVGGILFAKDIHFLASTSDEVLLCDNISMLAHISVLTANLIIWCSLVIKMTLKCTQNIYN